MIASHLPNLPIQRSDGSFKVFVAFTVPSCRQERFGPLFSYIIRLAINAPLFAIRGIFKYLLKNRNNQKNEGG